MNKSKPFWIGICFLNLCVVALFGFSLRSKILFSIPFIDYRNLLSAHSHFAFSAWVGLAIITFLIYDVLPPEQGSKKIYQAVLWGIQISSVAMAFSFPISGYNIVSIIFSTLYIFVTYVFGFVFFRDLKKAQLLAPVRWLSYASIGSLLLSSVGPFGLAYILATKSGNSILYRDCIYTFLHFQYNGFFTLGVFALFLQYTSKKGRQLNADANRFAAVLIASVLPSLFLSLLWHNLTLFYILAVIGCVLIMVSIVFFLPLFKKAALNLFFNHPLAKTLWIISAISFGLKMLLTIGTIYPPLGNAVYGARPVIIGFLHLVFLAFVSFFILSTAIEAGYFTKGKKLLTLPFYIFGTGVLANELFLMLQGLEILFKTNSKLYNWLLWGAAILLFAGAISVAIAYVSVKSKKAMAANSHG